MIVLGLNSFGHDAAAVLLVDGKVVYAASQERLDRCRHSAAFPADAIQAALGHAGIAADAVDAVAFPWQRGMARLRKAGYWLRHWPRSMAFLREAPDSRVPDRRGYLRAMAGLEARLGAMDLRAPVHRVAHHTAHAASAALALPEGTGAILTADGMGEWTTAATWTARAHDLRRHARAVYPHSPGKAYAAVTQWLGFRPESDEGKTMGLAAYGAEEASSGRAFATSLLRPCPRRLLRVDVRRFGFPWGESRLYGPAFLEALGPARAASAAPRPGDADVARGIQDAVHAFAQAAARQLLASTGAPALGLAGGLFLNCALNGRLRAEFDVPVLPFPVAGDAGAAWGAAAHVHRRLTKTPAAPLSTLALGHDLSAGECHEVAADLGASAHASVDALARAAAVRIARGRILGVARGRAEFGPRALGHRSVLASPTTIASRDRVNARKGREGWRPLAPIVRAEDARFFEDQVVSPHMILTFRATPRARAEVPGVVHVDGTARVQTVAAGENAFLRALLDALEALGQPPVVINTSLNRRGEPIVDTAAEALAAVRAMELDGLVLGDWLWDRTPFDAL